LSRLVEVGLSMKRKTSGPGKADASADDVMSPAGIERMLRKHLDRLHETSQNWPGAEGLKSLTLQLLTEPMAGWAVSAIEARLPATSACESDGKAFSDWYVAVTVCPDIDPDVARLSMPGGYLALMNRVTAPAWDLPGDRNVAHWIYCCDGEVAGVHLTMIPNPNKPRISPPLIAQDLLSAAERQQLNTSNAG
jgi:hypothetical protein